MILFQRGATGWGFQFGRFWFQINYWRYMVFGRRHQFWPHHRVWCIGHYGWENHG